MIFGTEHHLFGAQSITFDTEHNIFDTEKLICGTESNMFGIENHISGTEHITFSSNSTFSVPPPIGPLAFWWHPEGSGAWRPLPLGICRFLFFMKKDPGLEKSGLGEFTEKHKHFSII